jgi:hypothetical protein
MNTKRTKAFAPIIMGTLALVALLLLAATGVWAGPHERVLAEPLAPAGVVSSALSYQGRLLDASGEPLDGAYEMTFGLYDVPTDGAALWTQVQDIAVEDGLFNTYLDVDASLFDGQALWLGVQVAGDAQELSPRQSLLPAPYALALPGLWTQQNATSPNLIGGYRGNSVGVGVVGAVIGGGGDNAYPNQVTADYGTIGGGFGNAASGDDATVGGGYDNIASGDGASIGGGYNNEASGGHAVLGGGDSNTASGWNATVGGGYQNTASSNSATIGGGDFNTAGGGWSAIGGGVGNKASGSTATVGGGDHNTASGNTATIGGGEFISVTGQAATVAGGAYNTANGDHATVGGGYYNIASGGSATIGGGWMNVASSPFATIAGGYLNTADKSDATVGGGSGNTASGNAATVPGGLYNTAGGNYSFAAGRRAKANNQGCFVWADSNDIDFASTTADQFSARATGGVRFVLGVDGSGNPTWTCSLSYGGNWTCSSDRNLKDNLTLADGQETLERLAQMPVYYWNAKGNSTQHIGPMAQDFYAAFEVGDSDVAIDAIDLDGVALAAIQGLYAQNQELTAENATLQRQVDDLEARMAALEAAGGTSQASGLQIPGGWLALGGLMAVAVVAGQRRLGGGR